MFSIVRRIQRLQDEYLELKEREYEAWKGNIEEWVSIKNQLQEKWREMETLHILLEEKIKQKEKV